MDGSVRSKTQHFDMHCSLKLYVTAILASTWLMIFTVDVATLVFQKVGQQLQRVLHNIHKSHGHMHINDCTVSRHR